MKRVMFFAFFGNTIPNDGKAPDSHPTLDDRSGVLPPNAEPSQALVLGTAEEESNTGHMNPSTGCPPMQPALGQRIDGSSLVSGLSTVNDTVAIVRQIEQLCLQSNRVAFFRFSTRDCWHEPNEEDQVKSTASQIASGQFHQLKGVDQALAYLKSDRLRTIDVTEVHQMANLPDLDCKRVIFFGEKNKGPESNAFGMPFGDWCTNMHGRAKGIKRK